MKKGKRTIITRSVSNRIVDNALKEKKLFDLVRSVKIIVHFEPHVLQAAMAAYNSYGDAKRFADKNSSQLFLERIQVNYIRHNLTEYNMLVDALEGEIGSGKAYLFLKTRTLDEISKVYPRLAHECDRQIKQLI